MQNQDENIRVLELETREIQRQIDLLRKQVPDKANIESSLVNSQIEVIYYFEDCFFSLGSIGKREIYSGWGCVSNQIFNSLI